VWVWYLATGAVLAAARIALMVWLNFRLATHVSTSMDYFIWRWLYPEEFVSLFWRRLVALKGTEYYLIWGTLTAIGSFVIATPILIVNWLRHRA
jgi:hypothetical protein